MTLTLILMRHAKADRPIAAEDHDRPLTDRGRTDAAAMGQWLAQVAPAPDATLVSSALRTRETLSAVRGAAGWDDAATTALRRLYAAPPSAIRDVIADTDGTRVLVVGHNPGIAEAAADLTRAAPDHARFHDYPTGAATILEFEADDWRAAMRGRGAAVAFAVPADVRGA